MVSTADIREWKPALLEEAFNGLLREVTEVTGEYGFSAPEVVVDRPGDHEISATDPLRCHRPLRRDYLFGTARNDVLTVSTGCHLPADKHPAAGSPAPSSPGAG